MAILNRDKNMKNDFIEGGNDKNSSLVTQRKEVAPPVPVFPLYSEVFTTWMHVARFFLGYFVNIFGFVEY